MRRTDQRRAAVFALYGEDVAGPRETDRSLSSFTADLVEGVRQHRDRIDRLIDDNAIGWDIDRIAPLERAIMRVALYEILFRDDIPNEVAIDEAVDTTKEYCGADAPGFVNGILGGALKEARP